jgi:2,4-dienoyl-CoA reductase-like NADH-dependent reductase (Old Yellow Enzyme family)
MSTVDVTPLFRPFEFRSLRLRNRLVMAPMTRYFAEGGIPLPGVIDYYRRRAEGGVGLIVTEGVGIERPAAVNHPGVPVFHGAAALRRWQSVVEAVHMAGGAIAPQLWHVCSAPDFSGAQMPNTPESPSALFAPDRPFGQSMTEEDVADVIAAFARGAQDAQRLGFDCVEFHGAHGYLIDQFFWDVTNRREDRYGGDLAGRVRFAAEFIGAVREAAGPELVLILRISQWKQQDYDARNAGSPEALAAWLQPLADAGIDIFHCSQRRLWEPEFEGSPLNLAGWAKKLTGCPTISVGSVGLSAEFMSELRGNATSEYAAIDDVLERLDREEFDLVAVGRALIADPEWPNKIRDGRLSELLPFRREAMSTLY